jgi:hypothetical protein
MQVRSTCAVGPYKLVLDAGLRSSTLAALGHGRVYQEVVLGICYVCGELSRTLTLRGQ